MFLNFVLLQHTKKGLITLWEWLFIVNVQHTGGRPTHHTVSGTPLREVMPQGTDELCWAVALFLPGQLAVASHPVPLVPKKTKREALPSAENNVSVCAGAARHSPLAHTLKGHQPSQPLLPLH